MKIEEFLRKEKIPYTKTHHPEAFTAQEVAATAHVPGRMMVKVVVVKAGADYCLAVCPATHRVNLDHLSEVVGKAVRLANEGEMEEVLKDVDVGAEPPLGAIFGLKTYVDKSLAQNQEIVFQAGTHTDTIRISYADFEKIAKPTAGSFADHL